MRARLQEDTNLDDAALLGESTLAKLGNKPELVDEIEDLDE